MKICSIEGCVRAYSAKGLCTVHYAKKQKQDNPEYYRAKKREYWRRDKEKNADKRRSRYNPEAAWAARLERNYGITAADYYAMLEAQGGVCAICKSPQPQTHRKKKFNVDHRHSTGKVRALLCSCCNSAVGHLRERVDLCHAVAEYLIKHNG